MMFSPVALLVRGVVSLLAVVAGVSLLALWADRLPDAPARRADPAPIPAPQATPPTAGPDALGTPGAAPGPAADAPPAGFLDRVAGWRPGFDRLTATLAGGVGLLLWSSAGRVLGRRNLLPPGTDDPTHDRGGETVTLKKPDGTALHVELYGPPDAPPVVLTHGWGRTGRSGSTSSATSPRRTD